MKCWVDRPLTFNQAEWDILRSVYIRPADIDLFVGGLLERRIEGQGVLGHVFGHIVGEQFRRLKDGDRFFFTHIGHEHSFTTAAIEAIKRRRLSDVLCDNTILNNIATNVFVSDSPRMNCSSSMAKNNLDLSKINLLLPPKISTTMTTTTRTSTTTRRILEPKPPSIRLVDGCSNHEGRVELFYQGNWGTVCDDSWDINDATVVCRMLGFDSALSAPGRAFFGQGTGDIIFDDVHCNGDEETIQNCRHNGYLNHNCGHWEDAGVICTPTNVNENCSTTTTTPETTTMMMNNGD